jgi:hypothetical protein
MAKYQPAFYYSASHCRDDLPGLDGIENDVVI